jgi:hypothetical protein
VFVVTVCHWMMTPVQTKFLTRKKCSHFEPRSALLPPYGWYPVSDRKFLNSQAETLEMLKSVTESKTDAVKIAIHFPCGWNMDSWCRNIELGKCAIHYQDKKEWVWVSTLFAGETGRSYHLCNLEPDTYGMDGKCSWCILQKVK